MAMTEPRKQSPVIPAEPPVVQPGLSFGSITDKIASIVLTRHTPLPWWLIFGASFILVGLLTAAVVYLLFVGVGIWGIDIPVAWGFAIVNFVWWIGIGHAGTLISAILLLMNQKWRTSINRFAEAMTLFAVACAGMFPLLHLGRPWVFFWMIPYLNTMRVWPQFRSPLVWDIFAVTTYLTSSIIFWYVGLLPDLGTMRDKAKSPLVKRIFGVFSLGWCGAARQWRRYEIAYLLLAGLCTPLVVSVHTVVSFDFTIAILPGWHSTFFPPYFVAGAIYSGFAMVLLIAIPLRRYYKLDQLVTLRHLDNSAKLMLVTGLVVTYSYIQEYFMAYFSADRFERYMALNRVFGHYRVEFWLMMICNCVAPQALWWRRVRQSQIWLWLVALAINFGMWMERFVIIITSLQRDFLVSSWGNYLPTFWDIATLLGTIGFFVAGMMAFIRAVPMISMSEMKELIHRIPEDQAELRRVQRFAAQHPQPPAPSPSPSPSDVTEDEAEKEGTP
jgi:molybdopterin-containing oxidoreductase family membrane subunit